MTASCSTCGPTSPQVFPFLDQRRGDGGLSPYRAITNAVGHILSVPQLSKAATADSTPAMLMRRPQALAGIVSAAIFRLPEASWSMELRRLTNAQTSQAVDALRRNLKNTSKEDAFAQSLALVFFHGAVGDASKQRDAIVEGYRAALAAFDAYTRSVPPAGRVALRARVGLNGLQRTSPASTLRGSGLAGLGSLAKDNGGSNPRWQLILAKIHDPSLPDVQILPNDINTCDTYDGFNGQVQGRINHIRQAFIIARGTTPANAETIYWSQTSWCDPNVIAGKIRQAESRRASGAEYVNPNDFYTRNLFTNVLADLASAGDFIVGILMDAAAASADLLCSIFKAIFGQEVGGVMCTIVSLMLKAATGPLIILLDVSLLIFKMLGKCFAAALAGNWADAGWAILEGLNGIIIVLIAGPMGDQIGAPITDYDYKRQVDAAGGDATQVIPSMQSIGAEVAHDDPLFIVKVIFAAISLIYGGANPASVGGAILALSPAAAAAFAPILKNKFSIFAKVALDDIKKGISAIIKIGALVVTSVMTIKDVIQKFVSAITRYYNKLVADPEAVLSKLWNDTSYDFASTVDDAYKKITSGNLKSMGEGLKIIIGFLPTVIVAIAKDDPDLNEAFAAMKKIAPVLASDASQAKTIWAAATQQATQGLPDQQKMAAFRDQIDVLRTSIDPLCAVNCPPGSAAAKTAACKPCDFSATVVPIAPATGSALLPTPPPGGSLTASSGLLLRKETSVSSIVATGPVKQGNFLAPSVVYAPAPGAVVPTPIVQLPVAISKSISAPWLIAAGIAAAALLLRSSGSRR